MSRSSVSRNTDRAPRRTGSSRRQDRRRETKNGTHSSAASGGSSSSWTRHGTALPGWTDLEPSRNRRRSTTDGSFLENASTLRFALVVLTVACGLTLYVGHVRATADLLSQLRNAQVENRRLHLKHNRLKGKYERRTGPSAIYERAHEMGLRASITYGPPIDIDE